MMSLWIAFKSLCEEEQNNKSNLLAGGRVMWWDTSFAKEISHWDKDSFFLFFTYHVKNYSILSTLSASSLSSLLKKRNSAFVIIHPLFLFRSSKFNLKHTKGKLFFLFYCFTAISIYAKRENVEGKFSWL